MICPLKSGMNADTLPLCAINQFVPSKLKTSTALDTNVELNNKVSGQMRYITVFYCPKGQVTKCELLLSTLKYEVTEVCLCCHGKKISTAT